MNKKRQLLNILLFALAITLGGLAVWLFRLPPLALSPIPDETGFGIYENRELVERHSSGGQCSYVVKDSTGNFLFNIPLKDCILDFRYRNGRLKFHDNASSRDGYIDTTGYITLEPANHTDMMTGTSLSSYLPTDSVTNTKTDTNARTKTDSSNFKDADLSKMTLSHPFGKEAKKILSGKLELNDSLSRRKILSYCEHLRSAYVTKDLDFIRQVFSDDALIIVGHTVKTDDSSRSIPGYHEKVYYSIRSKQEYLQKLAASFASNKGIDMEFSDFNIMRHPTIVGIYGVTLHQRYKNDRYSDDGHLFLLWDFRNPSMPLIHVRTWQPHANIRNGEELIDISDFNLE